MKYFQRDISFFTRIRILFFGKRFGWSSWFSLAMPISLYFMFVPFQDLTPLYLSTQSPRTEGSISHIQTLDNDGNKRYKIYYKFSTPIKGGIEGIAYSDEKKHQKGDKIMVIYSATKPSYAKIEGLDAAYYSFNTSIFQWLFLIVSVALTIYSFYMGFKMGKLHLALLKDGELCEGVCIGVKEEKDSEGDLYYTVSFEYTVEGQCYDIDTRTRKQYKYYPSVKTAILYDKQNPQNAVLQSDI